MNLLARGAILAFLAGSTHCYAGVLFDSVLAQSVESTGEVVDNSDTIGPAGLGEGALADAVEQVPAPPLSPNVLRLVESELLSEQAKSERRLFHGLWRASDLEQPDAQARAMLVSGAWFHPVFDDGAVPAWVRARAMMNRGEVERALGLVAVQPDTSSVLVRAEALYELGRYAEAAEVAESIGRLLDGVRSANGTTLSEQEIVDCVNALLLGARVRGVGGAPEAEYARLLGILTSVHQVRDRLYWPAMLSEAELLVERGARSEAASAIQQVLSINPRCARAWTLLGLMYVDAFELARSMGIAERLDQLVASAWRDSKQGDSAGSLDAHLIRARRWVRQNDFEFAQNSISQAMSTAASSPRVLAVAAGVSALSYDDAVMRDAIMRYEGAAPGGAKAHAAIGKTLSERRQYALASSFLRETVSRLPYWSEPWSELGLLELQAGRIAEGLEALEAALELDPFHTRASNTLVLAQELLSFDVIETDHFIVRYAPGPDRALAQEMARVAEVVHADLSATLQYEPDIKTSIDLMPDHERFAVRVTGMPGVFTVAACTGPVVAMESPRDGKFNTGPYDWERVFIHEYAHTLTLGMTENRIPHWLTEAFSVQSEDAPRPYGWWRLLSDAAQQGRTYSVSNMSLGFIRPDTPADRTRAYAQAEFVLEYIVERFGEESPAQLLRVFREGSTERDAWPRVLGLSVEVFDADFGRWAEDRFGEVGLRPDISIETIIARSAIESSGGIDVVTARLASLASGTALELSAGGASGDADWEGLTIPSITEENIDGWVEQYPTNPDLLEISARNAVQRSGGVPDESHIDVLTRYIQARPIDDWPHLQLVRVFLDAGRDLEAAEHLAWLDEREVNSSLYASALARIRAGVGDWTGALEDAQRATRREPFDPEHREAVAEIALRLADYELARSALEVLELIEPQQTVHTRRLEALDALQQGR